MTFQAAGITTFSLAAYISSGAGVPVVTGVLVGQVDAAFCRIAVVIRTQVVIITRNSSPTHTAGGRIATFYPVAGIAVVANQHLTGQAAHLRVTRFQAIARVLVVANEECAAGTDPGGALVLCRAHITVVASRLVVQMKATGSRIAGIVSTQIAVVAVGPRPGGADSRLALVANSARVPVVANEALVVRNKEALAGCRLALGLQTESVQPFRLRALHDRIRSHGTLVRKLLCITEQSAVAQVAVFQSLTICVHEAVARHRNSNAVAVDALVRHCTGVAIIAGKRVRVEIAAAGGGADVVGARVVVVALQRVRDAGACFAMVGHRAGVSVAALPFGHRFVAASFFAEAGVCSALVAIVAHVHIKTVDQIGFINLTVAVIVQPVAHLGPGYRCIAIPESVVGADPLAVTETEFVFHLARSGKAAGH